ncbi:MAG: outer membrane beta-barrel protein [Lamprobacter sp.]|uniref:outer membrane beta-barrel protein n=1 Tax=Lamprobacter sp. TaxID=3100796 RepID=UPI002B25722F|nr:outer membrane beta-barrel protein [Lamprobacter sp.]MEA3641102.1 outer membrane beta-barrel protein [Lamprobacter sp.]
MRALTTALVASPILGAFIATPLARAQDPSQIAYNISVGQRPFETQRLLDAYDIGSARLGAWLLTPVLQLTETSNSNIFATADNEIDDFITSIRPEVELESDWNRHQTLFKIGADSGLYRDNSDENYNDYHFSNRTRLDISHGTRLTADLRYRHAHTPRSSAENVGAAAEPLEFDQRTAALGLKRSLGIFTAGITGEIERVTYSKSNAIGGGTIDNSDRDRTETRISTRLGYEPFAESTAYLEISLNDVDYDDPTKLGDPNRDNSGFTIDLGAKKIISNLWVIDVGLGYHPRDFANSDLDDISGTQALTLRGEALWNPTALTSVIGSLRRQTYETTVQNASAVVNTFLALNVEHQLLRSLTLNAGLNYSDSDFVGSARTDRDSGVSAGLEYVLTRFISLRADVRYRQRDSSLDSADYDQHLAEIGLRLSL